MILISGHIGGNMVFLQILLQNADHGAVQNTDL